MVLVGCILDGREGHFSAHDHRRAQDIGRARELTEMVGVPAARFGRGNLLRRPPDGRERMDPEHGTRSQAFLESAEGEVTFLVDSERAFIQGGSLRGNSAVQGVTDGRALGPAAQYSLENAFEEARIARQIRCGNDLSVCQGIRGRQGVAAVVGRRGKGEGQFPALHQFVIGDELTVHGFPIEGDFRNIRMLRMVGPYGQLVSVPQGNGCLREQRRGEHELAGAGAGRINT